jgi:hypothetical protein
MILPLLSVEHFTAMKVYQRIFMIAQLAMHHSAGKKGGLRWIDFDYRIEIINRSPWLTELAPKVMPFEISSEVSRILLQPLVDDLKTALRIGATKSMKFEYFFGCVGFLHR